MMETFSLQPSFGRFDLLQKRLSDLQETVSHLSGKLSTYEDQKDFLERRVEDLKQEELELSLVLEAFKSFIDREINEDVKAIRDLQNEGLRDIFYDQDLSVTSQVSEHRGKVSVTFDTVQKSGDMEFSGNVVDSFGGSVSVIQGILFRISVIFRRGLRPVLLLDETLRFVSDKYSERAVGFLHEISEKLGMDILLITHDEEVVSSASRVYRITQEGGRAVFKKVKG